MATAQPDDEPTAIRGDGASGQTPTPDAPLVPRTPRPAPADPGWDRSIPTMRRVLRGLRAAAEEHRRDQ